jgi:hypothetical protein
MKKNRKRKWLVGLSLLAIILVIGSRLISQFSQPVNGVVKIGKATSSVTTYSMELSPKAQVGQYASFDYPKGLSPQKPASTITPPILQQYDFVGRDIETWILVTSVANLPSGQLSNDSSYTLRASNPSTYSRSSESVNGQSVIIMTDMTAAGFSKIAFMVHGDQVGTVSLTGDDQAGSQPLQTAFNMTLDSWHWQ